MSKTKNNTMHVFHIKNMVCNCCVILLRERLEKAGITVHDIKLGTIKISGTSDKIAREFLGELVESIGLELITDKEEQLIEQIKLCVIELVHQMNNLDSVIRKSDYLVEKLNMSYQQISKIFSRHEHITLEKFFIIHKVERIKELIDSDEYTISEIAYMMDYSSVQHLSNQFKKMTGYSVSDYKSGKTRKRIAIDKIGN